MQLKLGTEDCTMFNPRGSIARTQTPPSAPSEGWTGAHLRKFRRGSPTHAFFISVHFWQLSRYTRGLPHHTQPRIKVRNSCLSLLFG
uniref:Uncharacterized protein n=1 Tax=Knipowitschia caucasica TaxID=637954 RepID=A0AAV2KYM0_KNICA